MPLGYHVMCHLVDGRVIAPTPEARRVVAQVVLEKAAPCQLLAFNLPDTHLHLALVEDEATSLELARRIEIAVTRRLRPAVGFARAHPKVIEDQRHLFNVFDYIMKQQARHQLGAWDPLGEASNLPDLLGLRLAGRFTARHVRQLLPRVDRRQLLRYLGVEQLEPRREPLEQIVPAALAAAGLRDLRGRSRAAREVRRAIAALIGDRWPPTRIGALLGVDRGIVHRMRATPPDGALVTAIGLQLDLRAQKPVLEEPFVEGTRCSAVLIAVREPSPYDGEALSGADDSSAPRNATLRPLGGALPGQTTHLPAPTPRFTGREPSRRGRGVARRGVVRGG